MKRKRAIEMLKADLFHVQPFALQEQTEAEQERQWEGSKEPAPPGYWEGRLVSLQDAIRLLTQ